MGTIWMLFDEIKARTVPYSSFELRSQEFKLGWVLITLLPIVGDILVGARGKGDHSD